MTTRDLDQSLLTSYALGELEGDELARVEQVISADANAAMFVENIHATATTVAGELNAEYVEGLSELQHEVIEQRLRDAARAERLRRERMRAIRRQRWMPLVASIAASIIIVGGTLAILLPRLGLRNGQPTDGQPGGPSVAVAPTQPGITSSENLDLAQNSDEFSSDPVERMIDPTEVEAPALADNRPPSKTVTPTPANPSKKAVPTPTPAPAPAPSKPGIGLARSPEAEAVKPKVGVSAVPQKPAVGPGPANPAAKKSVNASTPRDAEEFKKIVKSGASVASVAPRVYENAFRSATQRPRSSFPVRVETWSYSTLRKQLIEKQKPAAEKVRIEELINRFAYHYPAPDSDGPPVAAHVEVAACPWDPTHRLARVAIKAREGGATVVAHGVEVSVKFNPEATAEWRLIGYENAPAPVSAGQLQSAPAFDLAAGGAATALYEIVPVAGDARPSKELFTVTVAYRDPQDRGGAVKHNLTSPATDTGGGFDRASDDFRFASSVAAFGMILRDSPWRGNASFADVIRWAGASKGPDASRERAAFVDLVRTTREFMN